MSKSNLNIKELEKKFDEVLSSFNENEINKWSRFDLTQARLEMFYSGEFQSVEIGEVEFCQTVPLYNNENEVFDYYVNEAC